MLLPYPYRCFWWPFVMLVHVIPLVLSPMSYSSYKMLFVVCIPLNLLVPSVFNPRHHDSA